MKSTNSSESGNDGATGHEANFSRQVSAILEKSEAEFRRREQHIAKFEGDTELEKQRGELERELWLMRVHLLEDRASIDYDHGEELKEMLANKLAVSSPNKAHPSDWWWTPANPSTHPVLREIQRTLEKETKSKADLWRRGMSYVWSVLSEFIYLAIVVGIFSVATSKFDTVVFSALIMVYNAVTSRIGGVGLGAAYLMYRLEEVYSEIGRTLGLKVSVYPAKQAAKQVSRYSVTMLIHNISIGIGSLIALWHLVAAVLS